MTKESDLTDLTTEEREELRRLRRENKQLREEREILKSRGLVRQGDRHDPVRLFGFVTTIRPCTR